jgi:excisionase family DNA binding protein
VTVTRMTRPEELPELANVDEAAAWLGCSRALVYALVRRRELDGVKLGRLLRIRKESLLKLAAN